MCLYKSIHKKVPTSEQAHLINSILKLVLLFFTIVYAMPSFADTTPETPEQTATKEVKEKKLAVDQWDDWNNKPSSPKYGVGIQGNLESQLNQLDKSSLLDKANGVTAKKSTKKNNNKMKPKNIKQMMAELKAMEAEVKQELNNETEF